MTFKPRLEGDKDYAGKSITHRRNSKCETLGAQRGKCDWSRMSRGRGEGLRSETQKGDQRTHDPVGYRFVRGLFQSEMGSHWRVLTRGRQELTLYQDHTGCHAG